MANRLETAFYSMPVFLQNAALSIYGLRLQRGRHTGSYERYYEEALARSVGSRDSLERFRDESIVQLLRKAVANVPYYRTLHAAGNFPIENVRRVEDIDALPLLEKTEVRLNPERFVSEEYRIRDLATINTTGTTGTPIRVYCNDDVRQRNYAFHDRFLSMVGIDRRGLRATIGGRIIIPASHREPPFWRQSYFQRNVLFSSYHLSPKNIAAYIEKLRSLAPDHIDCYPSSIYAIANFARSEGISLTGITKAIVTSGETLFDEQRDLIEERFGAKIFDQYGSAEMNVLVTSCKLGSYHIHSDFGVLEILNSQGSRVSEGEEGEIVCTGFINQVMPLIRYRIGDRAVAGHHRCECGCPFPTVARILGRDDDVIVTPSGDRVGRLSPVLKGFPVKEAQYVQERAGEVKVLIVVDAGYDRNAQERLVAELRKRLGAEIAIRIEQVSRIERGAGGKLKSIVSMLGGSNRPALSEAERE